MTQCLKKAPRNADAVLVVELPLVKALVLD
jgi:hypothetical protein